MDKGKEKQYTSEADELRCRLARRITREHGLTWSEMVKLTGMQLSERTLSTLRLGVDPDEYGSIVQ